jgi:hypothetical protein
MIPNMGTGIFFSRDKPSIINMAIMYVGISPEISSGF